MVCGHFNDMNNSLKDHNTFGIDVCCDKYQEYTSLYELLYICPTLTASYLHIGQGSNLLFTKDYEGTILHCAIKGIRRLENQTENGYVLIEVGGGEIWDDVVDWCVEHKYYGAENLSLIPGEMGAAVVQNIGAYGVEVADIIAWIDFVHIPSGKQCRIQRDECEYAYRSSIFKTKLKGECAIYSVTLRLSTSFEPKLKYGTLKAQLHNKKLTAKDVRDNIIQIRTAKLPDPKLIGNAGSYFMNPIVSSDVFNKLLHLYPNIPHYDTGSDGIKIPAGWLIEQCGWKGRSLGRAGVYEKQALVLVNRGGATGADILYLQHVIQKDVKDKFGIEIFPEVNVI